MTAAAAGADGLVDCHVHVLDPQRFPFAADTAYRPSGPEIGTPDQLDRLLDAHGIRHALIVGPNSGYGLDNRCLLDTLARSAGRYRGVAVVRNDAGRAELQDLQAAGIVGVAFNVALLGVDFYSDIGPLLDRLRELDLWAQVQVEGHQLVALAPMLEASGAKLLFDHSGRPDLRAGIGQPGFQTLLGLAATGRACVKLSGYAKFSHEPPPHRDAWPYVHALLQAYTPEALVWASDWPFLRAPVRPDYGALLALFGQLVPGAAARRAIGWTTPRRLFGFD
jgi:predicted TIM-barrel fold metal-dependent hydrolase